MFRKKYEENINLLWGTVNYGPGLWDFKNSQNELAPKVSKTPNDILKWFQAQVLHYKKVIFNLGSFPSYNKYIFTIFRKCASFTDFHQKY